jgi:hypothetical protein
LGSVGLDEFTLEVTVEVGSVGKPGPCDVGVFSDSVIVIGVDLAFAVVVLLASFKGPVPAPLSFVPTCVGMTMIFVLEGSVLKRKLESRSIMYLWNSRSIFRDRRYMTLLNFYLVFCHIFNC